MTDNYELAETLGRAAAHEDAAGEYGEMVKYELDTHNGEDVAQLLADKQETLGHFRAYCGMIDEVGEEVHEHVTSTSYVEDHFPETPITEEDALLAGYVLEKVALKNAQEAKEAAENSEFDFFVNGSDEPEIPYSISDIAREENLEMRELEDRLMSADYEISAEELETLETLEDL